MTGGSRDSSTATSCSPPTAPSARPTSQCGTSAGPPVRLGDSQYLGSGYPHPAQGPIRGRQVEWCPSVRTRPVVSDAASRRCHSAGLQYRGYGSCCGCNWYFMDDDDCSSSLSYQVQQCFSYLGLNEVGRTRSAPRTRIGLGALRRRL